MIGATIAGLGGVVDMARWKGDRWGQMNGLDVGEEREENWDMRFMFEDVVGVGR